MSMERGPAFKPPYPALGLLPFLIGGLFYAVIGLSGRNPGLGVQTGLIVAVITWFYVRHLQARVVLLQLEEELRAGNAANAPAMLAFVQPRILLSRSMVRKYLELRTMAALQSAIDSGMAPEGDLDVGPGRSGPPPSLSWPAVVLVYLSPFFFLPFFFLALLQAQLPDLIPYGAIVLASLVPVAAGVALSLYSLIRNASRYDRAIALAGLVLSLLALAVVMAGEYARRTFPGGLSGAALGTNPWPARIAGYLVLIISIMLHECAHGLAAYFSGDPTAKEAGRITLNPLRHIDPIGTILLPALMSLAPGGIIFGWAKPVPVNLSRLRHARRGRLAVSLAGVGVNLLLALVCSALLLLTVIILRWRHPGLSLSIKALVNPDILVAIQGVPWPYLWTSIIEALKFGVWINLILFNLNILPIPPLDGYGVVESLTPDGLRRLMERVRVAGIIAVLLLLMTGALNYMLLPAVIVDRILKFAVVILARLN